MAVKHPIIIQGGMGAAVSSWRLANAVARAGQLGVVSGTALDVILARRLQDGDLGGDDRRALESFPLPHVAAELLETYFVPGGKPAHRRYKSVPRFKVPIPKRLLELTVAGNFVEIFLAKEGHQGLVGINYLEKILLPNLPSLYGAMLAGVDYVLMGAGIPREIPGVIDRLVNHEAVSLTLHLEGSSEPETIHFDPKDVYPGEHPPLKRPQFLAIVASNSLATTLVRKASGRVDGLVIEGPTAGGHNAPPRGTLQLDESGEPIYGPRDEVDLAKIAELGRPFWLAGSYGSPEKLLEAQAHGATGVQVGTPFALCRESGLAPDLRHKLLELVRRGEKLDVVTDPVASPTGFPFKVVRLEGSLSETAPYEVRTRICDLGYLRRAYRKDDGTVDFRCPAEPVDAYLRKGGMLEETVGRKCLCNSLLANIGMPQWRPRESVDELPLVTVGNSLTTVGRFLREGQEEYTAADVIRILLGQETAGPEKAESREPSGCA